MPVNPPTSRQSGFSLIELLIGMLIALEILVVALTVFDVHNRMARLQLQITDMQQSLRVAQYDMVRTTRMAGRGGLPADFRVDPDDLSVPWLRGLAVEARDNVLDGGDNEVALGTADPVALPGTDILTVRGCLSGILFQMDAANPADFTPTSLVVHRNLPNGRSQDLSALLETGFSSPMLLQSSVSRGQYAVAEVRPSPERIQDVTLTITFTSVLSPPNPLVVAPPAGFVPGFACALEEYRYYVRQNFETPGDNATPLKPRLTRARMIPGTEIAPCRSRRQPHARPRRRHLRPPGRARLRHRPRLGGQWRRLLRRRYRRPRRRRRLLRRRRRRCPRHRRLARQLERGQPDRREYRVNAAIPARAVRLYYVRISTLVRTARRDPRFVAPDFDPIAGEDFIENNDYDAAPADVFKTPENRQYRHRLLRTVVDLRNI